MQRKIFFTPAVFVPSVTALVTKKYCFHTRCVYFDLFRYMIYSITNVEFKNLRFCLVDYNFFQIKTGGIVVWTKGYIHFVYRGSKYQQNTKHSHTFLTDVHKGSLVKHNNPTTLLKYGSEGPALTNGNGEADNAFQENDQSFCGQKDEEPVKGTLYEREVNRLLDTLGPRFVDWWWDTPLPVDADLLPEYVPGFKTPFRQCPPGVRPTLADEELTYLRKLARPLPTHFALGEYAFITRYTFC